MHLCLGHRNLIKVYAGVFMAEQTLVDIRVSDPPPLAVPRATRTSDNGSGTHLSERRGLDAGRLRAGRNHGGNLRLQLWHLVFVHRE